VAALLTRAVLALAYLRGGEGVSPRSSDEGSAPTSVADVGLAASAVFTCLPLLRFSERFYAFHSCAALPSKHADGKFFNSRLRWKLSHFSETSPENSGFMSSSLVSSP
jgi:hypothetical protein